MELGHHGVAAVAKFADLLVGKQMAIRTAVRRMTGNTTIDARRRVLENEGSVLSRVTFRTRCALETTELSLLRRTMWIVTRGTGQCVLL